MVSWSRAADLTQRAIVWAMVGVTAYASVKLAQGSYGVVRRYLQWRRLPKPDGEKVN